MANRGEFRRLLSFVVSLSLVSPAVADNVVSNGDFEGTWTADGPHFVPDGWIRETAGDPDPPVQGFAVDNGPSAAGTRSAHWVRVTGGASGRHAYFRQDLSVTAAQTPQLSLDVKVISHNLEGGGSVEPDPAFEWPVRVSIRYRLASNPTQTQDWVHGFYVDPPAGQGDGDPFDEGSGIIPEYEDTLVTAEQWSTHTFDLMSELPDLGEIIHIRIGGAGWSFEGQVDNLVLDVDAAVPAVSEWGLIAMTALVLTVGTLVLRRRRVAYA